MIGLETKSIVLCVHFVKNQKIIIVSIPIKCKLELCKKLIFYNNWVFAISVNIFEIQIFFKSVHSKIKAVEHFYNFFVTFTILTTFFDSDAK